MGDKGLTMNQDDPVRYPTHWPRIHRRAAIGATFAIGAASAIAWSRPWQKLRGHVTPESFGAVGDGVHDDAAAFRDACRHCAATGDDLRLSRRRYRGARIEVHGSFNVLGEGATVDYLGVGNTLIEGRGHARDAVATAWPALDRDAYADRFPVRGFALARSADPGERSVVLRQIDGLRPGDRLFLAQRPTSMSSGGHPGNYIPSDFAFVQVDTVMSDRVVLTEPLPIGFERGTAAFLTTGIAVGCRIADLRIATDVDAYQHVVRSGIDVTLERITFAGESAVGACTFADQVSYRNCQVLGAYGPLSVARGCGRISVDGLTFATRRSKPTAEPFAIFLEESFREVELKRVEADGAGFSIRSTDLGHATRRARVLLDDCTFQTGNAVMGPTGPFQGGVAIGVDVTARGCTFSGAAVIPDVGQFPGISRPALTWMASTGEQDHLVFTDCRFESVNGGMAIATGGGFQGRLTVDPHTNQFIGCQAPSP